MPNLQIRRLKFISYSIKIIQNSFKENWRLHSVVSVWKSKEWIDETAPWWVISDTKSKGIGQLQQPITSYVSKRGKNAQTNEMLLLIYIIIIDDDIIYRIEIISDRFAFDVKRDQTA